MSRQRISMDGNNAAAHVSYAFTEVAGIYPITPSSVMAEVTDKWSADGKKNIFGQEVKVVEMQSEAGAAGTVHGSLAAGALTTTYTASQGLLLMIPNMYKIAGELLPGVIHCSARALASHALSIFGDHSDVMACRQTGFAMLCAGNVQEVMDLGAVAHLAAIKGRVPFLHFFDGFRTSHEIQKIEAWDYETLAKMVDMPSVEAFKQRALNPEHPVLRGTAQNPDIFFQAREACNKYYDALPEVVEEYMDKVNAEIGTNYKLFNYYGAPDADKVIIAMGSVCDTIEEVIDYENANGAKLGLVKVRLYRPFKIDRFIEALPETVKKIAVLDRTKEPGAISEPLFLDVINALHGTKFDSVKVIGGRYGLGSKDTTPACVKAVYNNLDGEMKDHFTVGIEDDVTNLSLAIPDMPDTSAKSTTSCKFWGLGSDGTVGANKNSIKIIGDHTDMYAQAYFEYDSKKSGGITISHLRFGNEPIKSTYYVSKADFVACHNPSYIERYDMVQDVKKGGTFLLNCQWDASELGERLPAQVKKYIAENDINFYIINAIEIAKKIGLGGRTNTVLQSAFFNLAKIIPEKDAIDYMKKAAYKSFAKKGDDVVQKNYDAIDAGFNAVVKVDVPADWKNATGVKAEKHIEGRPELVDFVKNILIPVSEQKGDTLPVSAFKDADGQFPQGSAAYEKRGVAVDLPSWNKDNCIQCNLCSYVCPHATIRPIAMKAEDAEKDVQGMELLDMTGMPGYKFGITVSALDCLGCGSCVQICPGKKGEKALTMKPFDEEIGKQKYFDLAYKYADNEEILAKFKPETPKGSQFKQPLLEFSGACAGCGETPYAKLITQLFGDRMIIANATGCSSIWGGSAPSTPYTVNKKGQGPAWANSLFEDNAEYGFGMAVATRQRRDLLADDLAKLAECSKDAALVAAAKAWLEAKDNAEASKAASADLKAALVAAKANACCEECGKLIEKVLSMEDMFVKKSVWIFGGDGWAYDIGFGGVDHVLASGEDVNVFVFDTEVYSNTGGQASKSTPTGSVAQFAAAGKATKKKDLANIAMSYGYVYVAQIAMGADYNQCVKALAEAEAYPGPSLVIAYAPCINHGIKKGMGTSMLETKAAVASGYWHTFRYNPAAEGKKFTLDSKEPTASYNDFILSETRYNSLVRAFPDRAEKLFSEAEKQAKDKYVRLTKLADLYE